MISRVCAEGRNETRGRERVAAGPRRERGGSLKKESVKRRVWNSGVEQEI